LGADVPQVISTVPTPGTATHMDTGIYINMCVMKNSRPAARIVFLTHVVLLCISGANCSQRSAELPFTLKQVGSNVWAAIDNPHATARALANAGFVIGDDGVAVIDTLGSAEAAPRLLAEIRRLTTLPVKFVINTHYHLDHVAGNRIFADTGAVVLAQRNVRGWVHAENLKLFGPSITPELKALTDAVVAPMVVYEQGADLYLGSREIQLRSFPGHTGGDTIVLIPDSKIVFAGDLLGRHILPSLGDASTKPWIDTLDTLLATNGPGHVFVPGHGDVANASDVAAFRDYLMTLRALVAEAQAHGKSGDAVVETVMPALRQKYGQWDFSEGRAAANLLHTDAELSGKKRIPQVQSPR
jgi:glyoxylase-like metal-dependent hydrolase (beta-lactamase superfamily II)